MLSHNRLEKDDMNKLFLTPKTLSTMVMLLIFVNLWAYYFADQLKESTKEYFHDPENPDIFEDIRWPIFGACMTLTGFSVTHFPDTIIKRPHPMFWRFVLGALLGYSVFMSCILILPVDLARKAFKIFHPYFGNPLPERGYADDCRVFTPEN